MREAAARNETLDKSEVDRRIQSLRKAHMKLMTARSLMSRARREKGENDDN
jgi:hypothetical protein